MKIYIVGGFIRDTLLGLEPKDKDFVVVGSSPEEMVDLGFTQVGADFPVFLHPETGDEVALARIERKVGVGYNGFATDWKGVTLEEDLYRRDLTINSMAQEVDGFIDPQFIGDLIDPFKGYDDIRDKTLNPVSVAFKEDSVRVLRVARFLARYGKGWEISTELQSLMDEVYFSGGLKHLVPERVFLETEKALKEKTPSLFFTTLFRYGIFEEVNMLYGVPQRKDHHPEMELTLEGLWEEE